MPIKNPKSNSKPTSKPSSPTKHNDGGGAPGPRYPIPCPPKPPKK